MFDIIRILPFLYYKVFEDNAGALTLAHLSKMCSRRTKCIEFYYHHYMKHAHAGKIKVHPIDTKTKKFEILHKGTYLLKNYLCITVAKFVLNE